MILRLAILIQYRSVADTQTDGWTDTRRRHVLRLAYRRAVKIDILHGPQSIITRQQASVDSKLLGRPSKVGYYHIFER